MGYYKNKLIEQQEQRLSSLYEDYTIEQIELQAQKQNEMQKLMHEELLLDEQIRADKEENQWAQLV